MKVNQAVEKMRVSFDLDEVLFVSPQTHETEPELPFPLNRIYTERLRKGTTELIPELQRLGFEVWIYTSSFRSERYIKNLFRHYHIHFDGIVNGERHQREVQANHPPLPTKLPSRYRISLHIDDEAIICTAGKLYGFNVYQLDAPDQDWKDKIIARVKEIQKKEALRREAARHTGL